MKALLLGTVAVAAAIASLPIYTHFTRPEITVVAETVTIPPGDFTYRPAGRYRVYGKLVDPPLETGSATEPLEIMRFQVSRADYAACVADGVCDAPLPAPLPAGASRRKQMFLQVSHIAQNCKKISKIPHKAF